MPYDLWVRGELDDHLHLPDRYFTVEIIGGQIIVSPAPALEHGGIITYYLLVDRDPKVARTILFSIPDQRTGAYLHQESWAFGETVRLPEPFGLGLPTNGWQPW